MEQRFLAGERQARRRAVIGTLAFVLGCALGAALICACLGCGAPAPAAAPVMFDTMPRIVSCSRCGQEHAVVFLIEVLPVCKETKIEEWPMADARK